MARSIWLKASNSRKLQVLSSPDTGEPSTKPNTKHSIQTIHMQLSMNHDRPVRTRVLALTSAPAFSKVCTNSKSPNIATCISTEQSRCAVHKTYTETGRSAFKNSKCLNSLCNYANTECHVEKFAKQPLRSSLAAAISATPYTYIWFSAQRPFVFVARLWKYMLKECAQTNPDQLTRNSE